MQKANQQWTFHKDMIKAVTAALIKKGGKVTKLKADEKKILTADIKLDGAPVKIKAAHHAQQNILFETSNEGKDSWFLKTRARYLCQVIEESSKAYLINIKETKNYIANPTSKIQIYETELGTQAFMIPIKTLLEQNLITDVLQLELNNER
jgi:hypothetical protein